MVVHEAHAVGVGGHEADAGSGVGRERPAEDAHRGRAVVLAVLGGGALDAHVALEHVHLELSRDAVVVHRADRVLDDSRVRHVADGRPGPHDGGRVGPVPPLAVRLGPRHRVPSVARRVRVGDRIGLGGDRVGGGDPHGAVRAAVVGRVVRELHVGRLDLVAVLPHDVVRCGDRGGVLEVLPRLARDRDDGASRLDRVARQAGVGPRHRDGAGRGARRGRGVGRGVDGLRGRRARRRGDEHRARLARACLAVDVDGGVMRLAGVRPVVGAVDELDVVKLVGCPGGRQLEVGLLFRVVEGVPIRALVRADGPWLVGALRVRAEGVVVLVGGGGVVHPAVEVEAGDRPACGEVEDVEDGALLHHGALGDHELVRGIADLVGRAGGVSGGAAEVVDGHALDVACVQARGARLGGLSVHVRLAGTRLRRVVGRRVEVAAHAGERTAVGRPHVAGLGAVGRLAELALLAGREELLVRDGRGLLALAGRRVPSVEVVARQRGPVRQRHGRRPLPRNVNCGRASRAIVVIEYRCVLASNGRTHFTRPINYLSLSIGVIDRGARVVSPIRRCGQILVISCKYVHASLATTHHVGGHVAGTVDIAGKHKRVRSLWPCDGPCEFIDARGIARPARAVRLEQRCRAARRSCVRIVHVHRKHLGHPLGVQGHAALDGVGDARMSCAAGRRRLVVRRRVHVVARGVEVLGPRSVRAGVISIEGVVRALWHGDRVAGDCLRLLGVGVDLPAAERERVGLRAVIVHGVVGGAQGDGDVLGSPVAVERDGSAGAQILECRRLRLGVIGGDLADGRAAHVVVDVGGHVRQSPPVEGIAISGRVADGDILVEGGRLRTGIRTRVGATDGVAIDRGFDI